MINRILIRMKVVQMLYSYLLTRSDFNILPPPETQSRDKRCAYSLYCDLLLLLIDQSGYKITNFDGRPRIECVEKVGKNDCTRIARALAMNDDMAEIALSRKSFYDALAPMRLRLKTEVRESSIFKEYSRKKTQPEIQDESVMWKTIFTTVLLRDNQLMDLLKSDPDFTIVGYEQALGMFDTTLNDYSSVRSSLVEARKGLDASLDKAYELYHSLLQLMIDLTHLRERQLDEARHKYIPTDDDLNPKLRFVENAFIKRLEENDDMQAYLKDNPVSWIDDDVTLKRILDSILESEIYKNYMEANVNDYSADCELWYQLFKNIIVESDDLAESLENQSVYWNDDLTIMGSFVLKTIKNFAQAGENPVHLLPKFKDKEDERFGPELFEKAIANREEYRGIIDGCLVESRWDPERLAFMDIVILTAAIAELLNFESIPTLVTINEYTEIANYYSTPKSGQFITGMLYSIIDNLKKSGRLVKM